MAIIHEDSLLHYNVPGIFAEAGLAIPNWSDDLGTFNERISELTELTQKHAQYLMFKPDVDLNVPPDIGVLKDIHRLYTRISSLLNSWAIPYNEEKFKRIHSSPSGLIWKVYPTPLFKVRNTFFRMVGRELLYLTSEMMQHTENRNEADISVRFAEMCASYLNRIYSDMCVRFFGKTAEEIKVDGFLLTDEDFSGYNPDNFYTDVEYLDTVPLLYMNFTEDQVRPLREGLHVTELPNNLQPYPHSLKLVAAQVQGQGTTPQTGTSGTTTQQSMMKG
jgi:hypothetical protein